MGQKDKIQLVITAGLIIIMVIILSHSFNGKKPISQSLDNAGLTQANNPSPQEGKETGLYARLELEADKLDLKRDPFTKMAMASSEGPQPLYLKGIFYDENNVSALINDEIVEIGSKIGENVVVDIKKDRVILNDGKQNFELKMEREK